MNSFHWYILYTHSNYEKKLVYSLNKKGIENYCPFVPVNGWDKKGKKKLLQPLFASYVFVFVEYKQLQQLKNIPGVINVVYRMAEPARINPIEIALINEYINLYSSIHVKKISIIKSNIYNVGASNTESDEKDCQVELPSLGYVLSAKGDRQFTMDPPSEIQTYQTAI